MIKKITKYFILLFATSLAPFANAQNTKHTTAINCTADSAIFSYTGAPQSFTVPAKVTSITIKAWGAGGGSGGNDTYQGGTGGGGAFSSSTLSVTPGEILNLIIGAGGSGGGGFYNDTGGVGGYGDGNGGKGGRSGSMGASGSGGGGGGATAILHSGSFILVAAGGGGGGGGGHNVAGGSGGGGGNNGGQDSTTSLFTTYKSGAGGIAGASSDSVGLAGDTSASDGGGGGGGGGGYNGGSGGGIIPSGDCGAGGGAGGNSLGSIIINGNGQTYGDSTYSGLPAGIAKGGKLNSGNNGGNPGGNGYVIISYNLPSNGFDLAGNLNVCIDTPSFSNASIQACIFNNRCMPVNGTLKLILDTAFHITSTISDSAAHVNGDTLTWNYDSLSDIGRTHCVSLSGNVSNIPTGDSAFVTMFITPTLGDSVPANNSVTYWVKPTEYKCQGLPFDPNEKSVFPQGDISVTTLLNYTIHFQNTGNAPAHNVVVVDTLSAFVDPTTLKVTSSSAEVNTTINSGNIVKFTFNNINLPDTATSKTLSIGIVKYTILPLSSDIAGTQIKNHAGIYFDANPEIITNTTVNTIPGAPLFVQNIATALNIAAFPNPFTTTTSIVFNTGGLHYLEVDDVTGRKLESMECTGKQYELSRKNLASGVYFIKAFDAEHKYVTVQKIVVE